MKINNPKSMLDFTRDQSSNNIAQNLVTVGQLYTIANKLTAKFDNKLKGVEGAGYGGSLYAYLLCGYARNHGL
jgi:hypothetical protein